MHRDSRLLLRRNKAVNTQVLLLALVLSGLHYFANNLCAAGATPDGQGCEQINCKFGEECVTRKFWCESPPCPSITYCSKSKKDSLKGPETCDSVLCAAGYTCVVQNRDCEWNKSSKHTTNCTEHLARCISERPLQVDTTNCLDVSCPTGHRCILRESQCYQAPCKLARSCALNADVEMWLDQCKQLGCKKEQECFLRKPTRFCAVPPCIVADCLSNSQLQSNKYSKNEYCQGWICPPYQECLAGFKVPCNQNKCQIIRSCQGPVMPNFQASDEMMKNITAVSSQTTLADLEKDIDLEENSKPQRYLRPANISNVTKRMKSDQYYDGIQPERPVTSSPNIRSTSTQEMPWLAYFKKKVGPQAILYWIQKSKTNDNYEGFVNWLDTISILLDKESFRLWLHELEAMSSDFPEFQAWILLYSLNPRPSSYFNRHRAPRIFDERSNSDYNGHALIEEQGGPNRIIHHGSEFDGSGTQGSLSVNLNEPQQSSEIPRPHTKNKILTTLHQTIGHPLTYGAEQRKTAANSNVPNYNYEVSNLSLKQQHFNNINKTLWKPWQTYYWPNSTTTNMPRYSPQLPMPAWSYNDNYTQERKNLRKDVTSDLNTEREQQIKWFSLNSNRNAEQLSELSSNQWSPEERANNMPLRGVQVIDNDLYRREFKPVSEDDDEDVPKEVHSLINQIKGLSRNNRKNANNIRADDNGTSQQLYSPSFGNNLPKLLIYFPPPYNFFIYYSVKNQSQTASDNSFRIISPNKTKNTRMIKPWQNNNFHKRSEINSDKSNENFNKFYLDKNAEPSNRYKKQYKQKEFAYIRKVIRELIEYWDDEEKTLENYNERDYDSKEDYDSKNKDNYKLHLKDIRNISTDNKITKPVFMAFLEWLVKRSYKDLPITSQKSRRKQPLESGRLEKYQLAEGHYNNNNNHLKSTSAHLDSYSPPINNTNDLSLRKIRILVDIDKNPEVLQSFFKRHSNAHSNKSDKHEYQIVVNLQDFFDSKEEHRISRKLANIAENQLHRNFTSNQKLPKILWVFPIYEDEENDTLIAELESNLEDQLDMEENEIQSTTFKFDESQNIINYMPNKANFKAMKGQKDLLKGAKQDSKSTEHKKSDRSDSKESKKEANSNSNKKLETYKDKQNKRNIKKNKLKQQLEPKLGIITEK